MSTFTRFTPGAINGVLAADTTKGGVAVALPAGTGSVVRIANSTTVPAFVALGDSKVTVAGAGSKSSAASGGFAIPAATVVFLTLPPDATTLAGITETSSTILWVNRGDGA